MMAMPARLAIVASHVVQYQDPFFRMLAEQPEIDLTVIYCSKRGFEVYHDAEMATTLQWDVELMQGYKHIVLRNLARSDSQGYFRMINPGIVPALARGRYDAVIFMTGWGSITSLLGIFICRILKTPFFLYGDSSFPPPESSFKARLRARFLRVIFQQATGFMNSGVLNADYYRHYGADERTFFLLPWAIDNQRFERDSQMSPSERDKLRESFGIAKEKVALLFSAKLVPRKDPHALIRAYEQMQHKDRAVVVFMGDGILRESLQLDVRKKKLERSILFTGFVNQNEIPKRYAMCDAFVLPSLHEPRGAVVNEAMVCGLPVVVSDRCGSIGDIVLDGDNAMIFPAGDSAALAACLDRLVSDAELRSKMAARSREIISHWDFKRGVDGVRQMLAWLDTR